MKCDRCQEQFTDYLEGSLPASQREQVAAHLRQCPDCAKELEAFRRTVAALRGLEAVAPPADLLSRINRAVAGQAQPVRPRFRVSWQHLGAAAAAAALVVGFVAVFSYQRIGPVSERLSGQPAGTVQRSVEQAVPDEESPAELAEAWDGKTAPVVSPAAPIVEKSVSGGLAARPKEAPGGEADAVAGREQAEPPRTPLASGQTAVQGEGEPALAKAQGLEEEGTAPGIAGDGGALAAGGRMTLGVGPYGRSSTPPSAARAEAGARVVITPPSLSERIVGQPVQVGVTIQPQASVESAVVRIQPLGGLELADDRPIIYQGPLPADKPKQLSFGIIARETGTQQCQVEVSSELPGVAASTTVAIPGFEAPPKHITTQVFEDTPLDEAIRAVAREADVKVTVGDGLEQKPVTCDFSEEVPAEAALRILAELGGCQLEVDNGTYRICCPAGDDGQ